jgi:hypothetical protein
MSQARSRRAIVIATGAALATVATLAQIRRPPRVSVALAAAAPVPTWRAG